MAFDVPVNDGFVTDDAGLLTTDQEQGLEREIQNYAKETSNQIAILIISSLGDTPIEDVSLEVARAWGIGQKEKNNGILLLISRDDRQVRLEVGYGLEGVIPDIIAKGIIDRDITPNFREAQYAQGLHEALDALKKHIGGEYTAERYTQESSGFAFGPFFVFIFVIGLQVLIAFLGRSKSWWLGGLLGGIGGILLGIFFTLWLSIPFLVIGGLLLDYIVSKSSFKRGSRGPWSGGGGWGSGGSSGGGSSFGGGSFGGGGASGRW